MSRLIDADKFAELMKRFSESDSFKEDCQKTYNSVYLMLTVDKEKYSPTAYDVDAVLEVLEEAKDETMSSAVAWAYKKAISAVKKGGIK